MTSAEPVLNVEPVAVEDVPAFRAMMVDYLTEMILGLLPDDVWPAADFRALREESGRWLWWAVVDGERIGLANFQIYEHPRNPSLLVGSIAEFYIRPAYRRQGYGGALAERVVRYLWDLDVNHIELNVQYGNARALAFWGALGFEIASYKLVLD